MRNLVDILDFTTEEIDELVSVALDIINTPEKYSEAARGRILATLFFEPSTRTRLSFTSAMMSLGGNVLGFDSAGSSSVTKGETLSDTIRMVSGYTDIIAMRHPKEGAPIVASTVSNVPIINAGDGGHYHPTQTLTDLLTIKRRCGRFDNLTVGICGDLKYGRTVHSLISAMTRYSNVKFVLISPCELKLPDYVKADFLDKCGCEYREVTSLEEAIPELDILYMTRIQAERFADRDEYERLKDCYELRAANLVSAKESLCILQLCRIKDVAILESVVLGNVGKTLLLDARHVEHVEHRHCLLETRCLNVFHLTVRHMTVLDVTGNTELLRRDQHKLDARIAGQRSDE